MAASLRCNAHASQPTPGLHGDQSPFPERAVGVMGSDHRRKAIVEIIEMCERVDLVELVITGLLDKVGHSPRRKRYQALGQVHRAAWVIDSGHDDL
jgi:hypothetical protein